jgi:hypothetical protein
MMLLGELSALCSRTVASGRYQRSIRPAVGLPREVPVLAHPPPDAHFTVCFRTGSNTRRRVPGRNTQCYVRSPIPLLVRSTLRVSPQQVAASRRSYRPTRGEPPHGPSARPLVP